MQLEKQDPATGNGGASDHSDNTLHPPNITQSPKVQVYPQNIPAELKALRQFVVWRYEKTKGQGKLTKPPYNPVTCKYASSTDSTTWNDFDTCASAVLTGQWDGIGFVFTENDDYAGVDFDHTEDAELFAYHKAWVERLNSYSERSPSGKGLHVIVKGRVPKGAKPSGIKIEVYSSERFFTMTGDVFYVPSPDEPIASRNDELNALWSELSKSKATAGDASTADDAPQRDEDGTLYNMACAAENGAKFKMLWDGDWQGHYTSQSEADFALIDILRFYTRSREQCRRMFRASGLNRSKATDKYLDRMMDKYDAEHLQPPESIVASVRAYTERVGAQMQVAASSTFPTPQPIARPMPEPLSRDLPPPLAYPIDALGSVLGPAARAIIDMVQCPDAIAGQSVLAAASLAVQAHADVVNPANGQAHPIGLFLVTVAESGERKSAADREALWLVREREKALRIRRDVDLPVYQNRKQAWDMARQKIGRSKEQVITVEIISQALANLGPEPQSPLEPMLTCPEPTFEGLCRLYGAGEPSLGLFSDEGGAFIGGHGMAAEKRLGTAAGLSGLWDGEPIRRVRVADGATVMPGRRLSAHLMMQPDVSARLLSDPELKDQGLLSRLCVSAPASTAGSRFQREPSPASWQALQHYREHMGRILAHPPLMAQGKRNELTPRRLDMSPDAATLWRQYADHVEQHVAKGGAYEPIKGFANKLPEHAARIATVLALVEHSPSLASLPREALERGIALADHYASEALRLFDGAVKSPDIKLAEKLLTWVHSKDMHTVELQMIYQYGPSQLRDKASAFKTAKLLESHGHLLWLKDATKPSWQVHRP